MARLGRSRLDGRRSDRPGTRPSRASASASAPLSVAAHRRSLPRCNRLSAFLPLLLTTLLLLLSPHGVNANADSDDVALSTTNGVTAFQLGSSAITVGDIFEIESECYSPLYQSDLDGDGKVDRTEYITFVNNISDDYFASAGNDFTALPLPLQANFIYLACLCEAAGGTNDCCTDGNAHLSTSGAGPDETPTDAEALYLFTVCKDTYTAVEAVRTESPTVRPTVGPTVKPTEAPSEKPTDAPTVGPMARPTDVPTLQPTPAATEEPTSKPTPEPTPTPETEEPTPKPTLAPAPVSVPTTPSPTARKTAPPTAAAPVTPSPTGSPTISPTSTPTASPTSVPTLVPTRAPTNVITGDLPVPIAFSMSNLEGYDAEAILNAENGNTILADVRGGLGLLVPEIVGETFPPERRREARSLRAEKEDARQLGHRQQQQLRRLDVDAGAGSVGGRMSGIVSSDGSGGGGGSGSGGWRERRRRRLPVYYQQTDPPAIDSVVDQDCPEGTATGASCQVTQSTAILYLTEEDPDAVTAAFTKAMDDAIADGRLEEKIKEFNPQTEVSGIAPAPAAAPPDDKAAGLSSGAIAGIAIGGAALVGVIAFLLLKQGRRTDRGDKDVEQLSDAPMLNEEDVAGDLGGTRAAPPYGDGAEAEVDRMPKYGGSSRATSAKVLGRGDMDSLEAEIPVQQEATARAAPQAGAGPEAGGATGGGAAAAAAGVGAAAAGAAVLGAAARQNSSREDNGSVSSAGSSGWSSSAGVSSLDENSLSREEADAELASGGPGLNAIGAASGAVAAAAVAGAGRGGGDDSTIETEGSRDVDQVPDLPAVSREDLDSAIEAGDWAAVGATAALLASASDSASHVSGASSRVSRSTLGSKSSVSSLDAARAAELDQLVDAGDWEGVVLAAAKFEAESANSHSASGSRSGSAGEQTGSYTEPSSRSVGTSSAHTQSTGVSESPSKAAKRAEIRTEVEALVRRVVPDEIDNVDEMMTQFRGREEELVETLRTMQERSIAQRARAAVHKSAKREARRSVQTQKAGAAAAAAQPAAAGGGGAAGAGAAIGAAAAVGAGVAAAAANKRAMESDSTTEFSDPRFSAVQTASQPSASVPLSSTTESSTQDSSALYPAGFPGAAKGAGGAGSQSTSTRKRSAGTKDSKGSRTALEAAIEAGDWEAVGEAAALMSDASTATGEGSYSAGSYASSGTGLSSKGRSLGSTVDADRAAELDRMIDAGDWTGVVQAAGRFSSADKDLKSDMSSGSQKKKQKGGYSSIEDEESGSGSGGSKSWRKKMFGSLRSASSKSAGAEAANDGGSNRALQEEQEALAQAEIWEAIAAQSKQEAGSEAQGASDAADWAISRSLTALKKAEESGEVPSQARQGAPSASVEDDKSV